MLERMAPGPQVGRYVSLIAATVLALACGTMVGLLKYPIQETRTLLKIMQYAYSAWGPQYAERMLLSSTQQNLIVRRAIL